ncbi:hypothetical protein PGT21_007280 [Puccinia graminis f. sp. tritici]|uniref:Uncharacterized protein n=1 Tax=Puccinia graminis f. sp. tritici TaxID=56615 RepID=A0A5B0QN05_PUCGR|nr:hypothetical protein PGT21_007280 [Puccinia graminis f. sp. tritici]KAA1124322.1 hypothetical protein PGTUg99_026015 [Puccinia graminis f. sp. tritici]
MLPTGIGGPPQLTAEYLHGNIGGELCPVARSALNSSSKEQVGKKSEGQEGLMGEVGAAPGDARGHHQGGLNLVLEGCLVMKCNGLFK